MKKVLMALCALFIVHLAQSQIVSGVPIYHLNGNIGIGTTVPNTKLEVMSNNHNDIFSIKRNNSSQGNTFDFRITSSPNGSGHLNTRSLTIMAKDHSADIAFLTDPSNTLPALTVKSNNRVGIGTASPLHSLQVQGEFLLDVYNTTGNETGIFFREGFSTTNKYNLSILAIDHNGSGSTPDGLSINAYDGISFSTNSNSRNERMRIARNGNVGIGTNNPTTKLQIESSGNVAKFGNNNYEDQYITVRNTGAGAMFGLSPNNDGGALQLQAGDNKGIRFRVDGSGWGTGIMAMQIARDGKIGIGIELPAATLDVNGDALIHGKIESTRVKVTQNPGNWPDYVFEPNYELRSLDSLEEYINTNQHLPEVPSAAIVEKEGIDLGNMDATLLKKVEELTLYLIDQNKTLKEQAVAHKAENEALKRMYLELKKEIDQLKKK